MAAGVRSRKDSVIAFSRVIERCMRPVKIKLAEIQSSVKQD